MEVLHGRRSHFYSERHLGAHLERHANRYLWVLQIVLLVPFSLLLSLGIRYLIEGVLIPYLVVAPVPGSPPLDPDVAPGEEDGETAIAELLTTPAGPDLGRPPLSGDEAPSDDLLDGDECPTVQATLVGTMTDREGVYSAALVRDHRTGRTVLVTAGGSVAGASVLAIERFAVWVELEGCSSMLPAGVDDLARADTLSPADPQATNAGHSVSDRS